MQRVAVGLSTYHASRRSVLGWAVGSLAAGGVAVLSACAAPAVGGQAAAGRPRGPAPCSQPMEVWSAFTGGSVQDDAMKQLAKDFAQGKTGCSVTVVQVPTDLQQKLTVALAGGSQPATATLAPSSVTTWSTGGLIQVVDDLFKRDNLNKADFPPPLWEQMNYGGKTWFLPLYANADFILHWNKGHFREAGLDPETGPVTIAELDPLIPKLTVEQNGSLTRVGMEPWNIYGVGNTIEGWGYAFGGAFKDEKADQLTFNHPRIQRAVEWYTGWASRIGAARVATMETTLTPTGGVFFATNRLSIAPLTSPSLRFVQKYDPSIQIGAGLRPGEDPGKPGEVAIGGWATAVVTGTKQRESAWQLVKYLGADETGTLTVARIMGLPGWLKSPGLAELAKDPLQKAYVDGIRRAQFPQIGFYSPAGYDLSPIQDVIDGKRSAKDALDAINRDANAKYDQWKAQHKG